MTREELLWDTICGDCGAVNKWYGDGLNEPRGWTPCDECELKCDDEGEVYATQFVEEAV